LERPFASVLPECDDRQVIREAVTFGLLEESERGDLGVSLDFPMHSGNSGDEVGGSFGAAVLHTSSSVDSEASEQGRELELAGLSLAVAICHRDPLLG
jgi:hypothetical protein